MFPMATRFGDTMKRSLFALAAAVGLISGSAAFAGDNNGNFMVRVLGAGVITDDKLTSLKTGGGADLKALGFDAKVSDEFIPAATLSYFFTKNVAVELFCCFSKHDVTVSGPANGQIASSWIFPPAVTLQYHFDGMGAFKPYVGVGAQYIHFFSSKTGNNVLGSSGVDFGDAFGPTLQAGFDLALGQGWYLNADVKKSWLDTKVTWNNSTVAGGDNVLAKVDLDPWIISAGVGYRFNLEDIFGRRSASVPLK